MIDAASSIPPTIILQNTINALSSCLSVLTSLVGLFIFIVSFIGCTLGDLLRLFQFSHELSCRALPCSRSPQ